MYIIVMNRDAFWQRIKSLLKEKGLTQETAAKACHIPYNTFRKWVSRKMIPPLNYAYRLSTFLGVSLEYLISGQSTNQVNKIIEEVLCMHEKQNERLNKIRCLVY